MESSIKNLKPISIKEYYKNYFTGSGRKYYSKNVEEEMKKDGFRPIGNKLIEISENGVDWEEFSSLRQASRKIPFLNPASISYAMKHPKKSKFQPEKQLMQGFM